MLDINRRSTRREDFGLTKLLGELSLTERGDNTVSYNLLCFFKNKEILESKDKKTLDFVRVIDHLFEIVYT